ncbi:hypothetical protein IPC1320_16830 [Pseudomonas aeruginosa]|uniref:hypothetical protein n=1 Tax=Pseudomonas aeruginosa TaxID=287 RepID=UPI0010688128|nr:hypothetical protein [Pseudomonas aeruginosa]TEH41962.1 hypothetical protein IPC1320_16830 [Pseudomonas aeruginosa]
MAQQAQAVRGSQKLIRGLKEQLDLSAVNRAEAANEITANQALRLRKWINAVLDVRENPVTTSLVQDAHGQFIGEVTQLADGKQWLAQGHGKTWPTGEAFDDVQQAIAYVRGIAAAQ